MAQVAASFTSSLAYVLPREYRPRWVLGEQHAPSFQVQSHVARSVLFDLNIESISFVGTIAASALTTTPTNPPTAQILQVNFDAAWDGGNIEIDGTDVLGNTIQEIFTPTGTPIDGVITRTGSLVFDTVTALTNTVGGTTGSAYIGLTATQYIQITEVTGNPIQNGLTAAGTTYLTVNNDSGIYYASYGSTSGGDNDNQIALLTSGQYTIPYKAQGDQLIGNATPGGGFDLSDGAGERGRDRLYLEYGDRGLITVVLGAAAGSLTGNTATHVVTDINSALTADARYGASGAAVVSSTGNLTGTAPLLNSALLPFTGSDTQGRLRLHLGCADASREIFGLPRYVGDAAASATATDTSITYTANDTIGGLAVPYTARIGRGLIGTGTGTLSASAGRFSTFSGGAHNLRVGECIRLESTTGGNAGLHEVYEVVSATDVRIRHENVSGSFSDGGGQAYQAWSLGDQVTVIDDNIGTQVLTLDPATPVPRNLPTGFQIELDGEIPYSTSAEKLEADSSLVIQVNTEFAPTIANGNFVENDLVLAGGTVPDHWFVAEGVNVQTKQFGLTKQTSFSVERGANDIELITDLPVILRGFPLTITFGVQQHNLATQNFRIDARFNGVVYSLGTPTAVPGTIEGDGASRRSVAAPTIIQRTVVIP